MCAPFKASLSYPPKPLLLKTILLYGELEAEVQMYLFGTVLEQIANLYKMSEKLCLKWNECEGN